MRVEEALVQAELVKVLGILVRIAVDVSVRRQFAFGPLFLRSRFRVV